MPLRPPTLEPILLKTRITPATQPASTSTVAHPDGATGSQTQPPQTSGTRPRAADARLSRLPARHGLGRTQSSPAAIRYTAPKPDMHPLVAAARQPRITARLDAMRQRLAELKTAYAHGKEAVGRDDMAFLDLLVAMENAKRPALALSMHAIDHNALRAGNANAVTSLADALATSMRTGKQPWHAILSVNGYQTALSVRHDSAHPERISLVVVSSAGEPLSEPEWHQMATLLADKVNRTLKQRRTLRLENVPPQATIDVQCLHTGTQMSSDGEAIFALSAAKAMLADKGVETLHQRALANAGQRANAISIQTIENNPDLGPRFFKYMTYPFGTDRLLDARPELKEMPVDKKTGLPLREYQAAHMRPRLPLFGVREPRNTAYEDKRLRLYERAIAHLDRSVQLDGMAGYLQALRHAQAGGAEPPAPRDAEFIDRLVDAENMLDPQLRLSAHRVDISKLGTRDASAIASLEPTLAEGLRSGNGWRATLDLGGHHVAIDARHDTRHPTHLSLAVLDGTGSPFSPADWGNLALTLGNSVSAILRADNDTRTGKVWLTHLDVSRFQTGPNTALFALMAAKDMKGNDEIADFHKEALAQASDKAAVVGIRGRPGDALLEPEYGDGHASLEAFLREEQIQAYERAIPYFERSLGLPPGTH
ncbi:hypothetical protein LMG9673_02950 [Ralstonia pseudosolanacearum]|nr:hypothetical protein LMG9673_02950 [Ralstonia pseudosolanacearum]